MSITFKDLRPLFSGSLYVLATDMYSRLDLADEGISNYNIFTTASVVGDCMMFASSNAAGLGKFQGIQFDISTALAASGLTVVWEYGYYDAAVNSSYGVSWASLEMVNDKTNAFQNTGVNKVTWKIPEDWDNYINPTSTHNGVDSKMYYRFCVRARITAVSSITTAGVHSANPSQVLLMAVTAFDELTLTMQSLYDADKASTTELQSRTALTATDASAVNNTDYLRPAENKLMGGAANDIYLTIANYSGFTDVTIRLHGTDVADVVQTEDIVVTANGVVNATKYFKALTQTQITAVTGTGSIDYDLTMGHWGVVSHPSEKTYVLECNLRTEQSGAYSSLFTSKEEVIVFKKNWLPSIRSVFEVGEVYSGDKVRKGSTFILEGSNVDMSSTYLMYNDAKFYNTQIRCVNLNAAHHHGFWGGSIGQDARQTLADVYLSGFRNCAFSNTENAVVGVKNEGSHSEPLGAVNDGIVCFGGAYSHRPYLSDNGLYNHRSDVSGVITAPINPWQVDSISDYNTFYVDPVWPADALDTNRVYFRTSQTTDKNSKVSEVNSLLIRVADFKNNPLNNADFKIKDKDGDVVLNTITSAEGYVTEETGTVTSATINTLVDTSKAWATSEFFYREVLIISGTGAGQKRIIMNNNTATTLTVHVDWDVIPDTTSTYIIVPYLTTKEYSPLLYTNGSNYSIVTSFSPFTIEVSKTGYKTFIQTSDIEEAKNFTINLTNRRYPND